MIRTTLRPVATILVALGCFIFQLQAQTFSAADPVPFDPSVRTGVLPNGMTYYIMVNHKPENRAEFRLAVKAGSMQEDEDQLGLAHFVEHMAFNGTQNFSKNELVNYLERVGSRFGPDLNAYTSFDETVYMLQVRTDDQDQFQNGLLILRDWADGLSFEEEEIDKERGVVISEWRTGLSAQQRMRNEYLPVLYYNSRYAKRLPIGEPEIVKNAHYDVVRRFYKDWYRPELMAILVVGAVEPDMVEQKIRDLFGGIKAKSPARQKESDAVPPHQHTFVKVLTDPEATGTNVQVIYNHKFEKDNTIAGYRQRLVESLYNRMLGTRLADLSKKADPPFLFAYTGYSESVGDLATYSSYAASGAKDVLRAYKTLLEENQRVLQHGFTQEELERQKAEIMVAAETAVKEADKMESSRHIQRLVYHFLESNPVPDARQHLAIYRELMSGITAAEVSALAKKWITDQNRVILITAPEKERDLLPDSTTLISIMDEVSRMPMEPYAETDLSAPILAGDFPEQPVDQFMHNKELDMYSWVLANGIKVYARPTTFKNDEILMYAYSPGGTSLYGDDQYQAARNAASIIGSSGVGQYDDAALRKKLAGSRVRVSPFLFERYEGLSGSSSVKDQELMMQLTYAYLNHFRRDTAIFSAWMQSEQTRLEHLMANPQNWFVDQMNRIMTNNHPRRVFPSLDDYKNLKLDDILKIYAERFGDVSDMEFFFVGSFNTDSLKSLTGKYLGALPAGGRREIPKDIVIQYPETRIDTIFNKGAAPKSQVQLNYHGNLPWHPDTAYVLQSLIEVARIKLREALREDDSGVYGVSVSGGASKHPNERYQISISFNSEPERTQELIQSAMQVIERMKQEIDPDDIVKITEAQRQSRIKALEQNQFWMNAMITAWMDESDDWADYVLPERLERRIALLSPELLRSVARRYFNDGKLVSLVLYPERS